LEPTHKEENEGINEFSLS